MRSRRVGTRRNPLARKLLCSLASDLDCIGDLLMKAFKHILVPVDFSAHSDEAIRVAADLSRRYEGALTLLYVFELPIYPLPEGYALYTPTNLSDLNQNFERLLGAAKKLAQDAGAPAVQTCLLQGLPLAEVLEFARQHEADLIVMGTHGRTGVAHAMLGSVAERILRRAPCPVLTVRAMDPAKK
jgi:nucleotide-binding universal stress UspA family protein